MKGNFEEMLKRHSEHLLIFYYSSADRLGNFPFAKELTDALDQAEALNLALGKKFPVSFCHMDLVVIEENSK